MRYAFGKAITDLAGEDERIHLLTGDIGYRVFDEFQEKFSPRYHNMGICEQSMIGVSAGMALEGLMPWTYTITTFLIERPFEQIKLDINQQRAPVKLVGYADYPDLGPTHALSDERLMDLFPNIKSYYPQNVEETLQAVQDAYMHEGPTFISLKKAPSP